MKTSAVVSDTIGNYPSTTAEDKAAALEQVRRAQSGDVDAFELLYREHSPRIYALCLRLKAGDKSDATELRLSELFRHLPAAVLKARFVGALKPARKRIRA